MGKTQDFTEIGVAHVLFNNLGVSGGVDDDRDRVEARRNFLTSHRRNQMFDGCVDRVGAQDRLFKDGGSGLHRRFRSGIQDNVLACDRLRDNRDRDRFFGIGR